MLSSLLDNMNQFISCESFPFNGQTGWITKGLQIMLFILKLSQPDMYTFAPQAALMSLESR